MIGACTALAITQYYLGDFETSGRFAKQGLDIWRSGGAQSAPEDVVAAGGCLCYDALLKWHSGETASAQATIEEAISLAKERNDMYGLAMALRGAKSRLPAAKPSESQKSRSRFRWRNAPKQPTRIIAGKKRVRQADVESGYHFGNGTRT
jgi:hypothetical protein